MTKRKIEIINIIVVAVFGLIILGQHLFAFNNFFQSIRVVVAFVTIFYLSGANITLLIYPYLFDKYNQYLFNSLSILNSIFVPPLLILALNNIFNVPLERSVYLVYGLIIGITFFTSNSRSDPQINTFVYSPPLILNKIYHNWPLFLSISIIFILHFWNVFSFKALPAPDTYSWLLSYHDQFYIDNAIEFSRSTYDRSLFASLTLASVTLSNLSIFTIYKYVFPFLSLITIIPLWHMCQEVKSNFARFILLLTPLISATIIMEFEITRHQIIFLIFLYFFVSLYAFDQDKNNTKLLGLLSIYTLVGSFYHPLFVLLLLIGLLAFSLQHSRKKIPLYLIIPITLLALISRRIGLMNMAVRAYESANILIKNLLTTDWNLKFPASYTNIDGLSVGWPGSLGVLKYYAFYIGPVNLIVLGLLASFLIILKQKINFSIYILRGLHFFPALLIFIFIFIAEFLPRFANFAYLPDRAWQFLGILLVLPLQILLIKLTKYPKIIRTVIYSSIILGYAINFTASIYLNQQMKYVIPQYEITASNWIKQNLPTNRLILTAGNSHVIQFHADSEYESITQESLQFDTTTEFFNYLSSRLIQGIHNKHLRAAQKDSFAIQEPIQNTIDRLEKFSNEYGSSPEIYSHISKLKQLNNDSSEILPSLNNELKKLDIQNRNMQPFQDRPIYIYSAKAHPKNPIQNRPYANAWSDSNTSGNILRKNPNIFSKVYSDEQENVTIWRINPSKLQ